MLRLSALPGLLLLLTRAVSADSLEQHARPVWKPLGLARRNATDSTTTSSSSTTLSTTSSLSSSLSSSDTALSFTSSPTPSTTPLPPGTSVTGPEFSYQPSSSTTTTASGTGTAPVTGVCSGATLNVLGASLDWWYTKTYTFVATTILVQYNSDEVQTGWTAYPATTTFDIASALAAPSCSYVTTYNSLYSQSLEEQVCESTPSPVAASTTVVSASAFHSLNATTGTGTSIPDVVITPAPASVVIPSSGGSFAAGTPFVFFSRYEIMTKRPTTYVDGSVGCAETTSIYNMSNPFSFEYAGGDVNGSLVVNAGVTGDVNPAFLGVVNVTNAAAGSWVAEPTVAVVLEIIVAAQAVLPAQTEASETAPLQTPTPTLPSGLSLISTSPTSPGTYLAPSARIESTQPSLDVPTKAPSTNSPGSGANQGGGNGGSNTSPTNALQVLTQVEQTTSNPLISAIVAGIGGGVTQSSPQPTAQPDGQGSPGNPTGAGAGGQGSSGQSAGGGSEGVPGAAAMIPYITVGSQTYTANAATQYSIGGSILTPGGQVVVGSSTISLAPGASAVVINGQTQSLSPPMVTASGVQGLIGAVPGGAPVMTVDGVFYTAVAWNAGSGATYVIDGQTLTPGGIITISGPRVETISLFPGGTAMVDMNAGRTTTSTIPGAYGVSPTAPPLLTVGGETFTAINQGATYVIGGQTLTPGESETVTVDGHAYIVSLAPSMTMLEIEVLDSTGRVTATSYETLFPASTAATTTSTVHTAGPSGSASATSTTAAPAATASNDSAHFSALGFSGALSIAIASFALAIWL